MRRPLTFCFSSSIRRSAVAAASAAVALAACAGLPEPSQITAEPGEVVIRRDAYGAPHIFAQSDYGLFYGYGYALAEDRLFQLEMLKRSSQGRVAELLGAAYADFDEGQRRLYWPSDIRAQIDAAPQNMRDPFQGMADGLNAHIARVEADPDALTPRQFLDFDFKPTSWSEYDVVMLFVGTMLLRYGDFNTELENLAFLNDLVAEHGEEVGRRIFDDVILRGAADAPTTIPAGADRGAHRRRRSVANAPGRSGHHPKPRPVRLAAVPAAGSAFSNAFVLGGARLKEGEALLVNGPQFGWYAPGYTYTVGFHAPGWNAVGNAPVGYPLPMFGYNGAITWGTTWGAGDNVDLFEERLNPDGSDSYFHKGAYKPLDVREETIGVRGAPDRDATFYRSVHGPIIRMDRGVGRAYAKQRGWAGRELETLAGWMEATKARSHKEWRKAVSKSALNVNWYFAGANGDIGYMFAGAYPKRHPEHDHRLPVSGEGAMDWRGVHPPSWNPQALNPPEGYFANWNNRPAADFPNPDMWWYSWSRADRVETLQKAIEAAGPLSADDAWALMMDASFVDPNARYFLPPLLEALASEGEASAASEQARAALTGWDGSFADLDEEGRYA
ncbi:MAG: penicillin acylase family protein, partial [Pseudomonadota bacterium]